MKHVYHGHADHFVIVLMSPMREQKCILRHMSVSNDIRHVYIGSFIAKLYFSYDIMIAFISALRLRSWNRFSRSRMPRMTLWIPEIDCDTEAAKREI